MFFNPLNVLFALPFEGQVLIFCIEIFVFLIKRIYHVDEVRIGKTRRMNLLVWTEP